MQEIQKTKAFDFEGQQLTQLEYDGRPCWFASELSIIMGYSEAKTVSHQIRGTWSDEFIEGNDYDLLRGSDLADVKSALELGGKNHLSHMAQAMVVFETGVHLVLAKTNKPAGKRLRRFLVEEVLPQIARDGAYLPEREITPDGRLSVKDELQMRLRLAEMQDRQFKSDAMLRLVDILKSDPQYTAATVRNYEIRAAELAAGDDLSAIKPRLNGKHLSPTAMGERLGITPQAVGIMITKLGIRHDERYSETIRNSADLGNGRVREVASQIYTDEAFEMIANRHRGN